MYCPNCGKATSTDQKFCRSCGLSLEKVAQSVAEQLPATELQKNLEGRQHLVERWLSILLGSAFAVFVVAVLWAVIYKIVIVKGDVLEGLIFLGLFIALVVALLLVIYRESLREAASKRQAAQPTLSQSEETAKLLPESEFEPIPSVTDRTTELLFAEKKRGSDQS